MALLDNGAVGNVKALALVVLLMLESDLAELGKDVLDEGVGDAALLAAHVVERVQVGHDVVDQGHDDGDGDRVHEDDADSDEVGAAVLGQVAVDGRGGGGLTLTAGEPAEDAEEDGQDVDGGDGTDELEGGEGLETTGDEDEPVLGQGDLEEEDLLDGAVFVNDTTVDDVHGTTENPGAGGEKGTKDDGDDPDLGQLPLDRALLEFTYGNGDGSQISEQGEEDDEVGADSLVDDDHRGDKVDLQVQAKGNAVLDVGLHALENLARQLDGRDDGAETGGKEHDIGSGLGGLGGTLDGDTAVGLLQRGSVVNTVTGHGSQVTTLLQHLDDLVLVLGEHLGETVGALAKIVDGSAGHVAVEKLVRVVDLGTELEHAACLDSDGVGVTSKHLNLETKGLSLENGLAGIAARGGPSSSLTATAGELGGLLLEKSGLFFGAVGEGKDGLGGTLGAGVADAAVGGDGGDSLGDGVEGGELLGLPAVGQELLGLGVTLESQDGDLINGVESLDVVRGSESGDSHHPVDVNTLHYEGLTDGQLVGGEGTGLVGAKNVDTSQGLDGSELLNNGLLLGEVGGTDGEGGGGNTGQTDGDTDDEENQGIVEKVDGSALLGDLNGAVETTDPSGEDEDDDEGEERSTDGVHDGLEVTLVLGALDKGSGLSDEGGLGAVGDDAESLAALATGGVVAGIGHELVYSEGLTSHGRLVNGDDGVSELGVGVLLITLLKLLAARGHDILGLELSLVGGVAGGVLVVANQLAISGDDVAFLDNDLGT
ncbi:hypothetical protein CTA1_10886 [Colletotrichum tanaceti]|uniref:Uncharacterized protein n=1 Tax=Colletotrichum tanaceti TaxID=1306861 RepID=A0A4U6XBS3_9PEZI|nr:hypothetical protein CTA1_10886 [Colletotrichum tanaceti]